MVKDSSKFDVVWGNKNLLYHRLNFNITCQNNRVPDVGLAIHALFIKLSLFTSLGVLQFPWVYPIEFPNFFFSTQWPCIILAAKYNFVSFSTKIENRNHLFQGYLFFLKKLKSFDQMPRQDDPIHILHGRISNRSTIMDELCRYIYHTKQLYFININKPIPPHQLI